MASELLNGAAMPLETDLPTFEEHRAQVREAYCNAIGGLLDDVSSTTLLPDEQALILSDAIQFTVFIGIIKTAEALRFDVTDRKVLMQIYRPLNMLLAHEVPTMLMQFVDAKTAGER